MKDLRLKINQSYILYLPNLDKRNNGEQILSKHKSFLKYLAYEQTEQSKMSSCSPSLESCSKQNPHSVNL